MTIYCANQGKYCSCNTSLNSFALVSIFEVEMLLTMNKILSWTSVEGVYMIYMVSKQELSSDMFIRRKVMSKWSISEKSDIKATSIRVSLRSAAATSVSMFKAAPNPVL